MTFPTDEEMLLMYGSGARPGDLVVGTRLVAPDTDDPDEPYGWHLALDLAGCRLESISNRERVLQYGAELCTVIDMKPYGEPWAERFGLASDKTAGLTGVQLVETSSVVSHYSDAGLSAFMEIFSCRLFDASEATLFTVDYFGATAGVCTFTVRRAPHPEAGFVCNFPLDLRGLPGGKGGEVHLSGSAATGEPGLATSRATEPGA